MNGYFAQKMIAIDLDSNIKRCILDKVYGNLETSDLNQAYAKIPDQCPGCSNMIIT
ncbi:unnamed protein product [marine sediment metagenome]|uniref:Uncharacterized protein n=1 Tax=marine sediment metagenome TaxID=412755 RepID=X1B073_9ZZZZ